MISFANSLLNALYDTNKEEIFKTEIYSSFQKREIYPDEVDIATFGLELSRYLWDTSILIRLRMHSRNAEMKKFINMLTIPQPHDTKLLEKIINNLLRKEIIQHQNNNISINNITIPKNHLPSYLVQAYNIIAEQLFTDLPNFLLIDIPTPTFESIKLMHCVQGMEVYPEYNRIVQIDKAILLMIIKYNDEINGIYY